MRAMFVSYLGFNTGSLGGGKFNYFWKGSLGPVLEGKIHTLCLCACHDGAKHVDLMNNARTSSGPEILQLSYSLVRLPFPGSFFVLSLHTPER